MVRTDIVFHRQSYTVCAEACAQEYACYADGLQS